MLELKPGMVLDSGLPLTATSQVPRLVSKTFYIS